MNSQVTLGLEAIIIGIVYIFFMDNFNMNSSVILGFSMSFGQYHALCKLSWIISNVMFGFSEILSQKHVEENWWFFCSISQVTLGFAAILHHVQFLFGLSSM